MSESSAHVGVTMLRVLDLMLTPHAAKNSPMGLCAWGNEWFLNMILGFSNLHRCTVAYLVPFWLGAAHAERVSPFLSAPFSA